MNELSLGGMLLAGLLGISSPQVTQISTTERITCAVFGDGALKCWGLDRQFVLARGYGQVPAETPGLVPRLDLGRDASGAFRPVAAVSVGGFHACAIMADDRSVKCWGDPLHSDHTLPGRPDQMGNALPAVRLGPGDRARSIAVNTFHACAVLETGTVKCWGRDFFGALGHGNSGSLLAYDETRAALPPVDLGRNAVVQAVAVGLWHTCALYDQGSERGLVKCWGGEGSGGNHHHAMGDTLPRIDFGEGRHAIDIKAGSSHNCALLDDGSIKCWGINSSGQLGIGSDGYRLVLPSRAVNLGRNGLSAIGIGVGAQTSCATLSNRTVKCWGQITSGEPGRGLLINIGTRPEDLGDALRPVNLGRGQTVESVSVALTHACAILSEGRAKCWGWNGNGQLGVGDRVDRHSPQQMGDALPFLDFGAR